MKSDDSSDDVAELLIMKMESDGIAVATVEDGAVFLVKRSKLVEFINQIDSSGEDKLIIFVQSHDPSKSN